VKQVQIDVRTNDKDMGVTFRHQVKNERVDVTIVNNNCFRINATGPDGGTFYYPMHNVWRLWIKS
jgi:hypothetical protein